MYNNHSWIETSADVEMSGQGNFIIIWMEKRNSNNEIYRQRFNQDGEKQRENFEIDDDDNW